MNIRIIIENTLYFLALINPVSKILFLSSKNPPYKKNELITLSLRSSIVAWLILATIITMGKFLFEDIFHVSIYALSTAGGIILFIVGLTAVRKGSFYEDSDVNQNISNISIVPLAAPLIAGPGTITAAISFSSINGIIPTFLCVTIAVFINLLFMLSSFQIGNFLERTHATGPLIRITGLIVTAVAMQMIFSGCASWINTLR